MKVDNKITLLYIIALAYGISVCLFCFFGFFDIPFREYNIFEWIISILFLPFPTYPILTGILIGWIDSLHEKAQKSTTPSKKKAGHNRNLIP